MTSQLNCSKICRLNKGRRINKEHRLSELLYLLIHLSGAKVKPKVFHLGSASNNHVRVRL